MTLVVLPSAVGMIVVARPLIAALLGGELRCRPRTCSPTSRSACSASRSTCSSCAASTRMQDTRTPFLLNVVENGVNVVLAFALVGRFGVQGLAFAYSAAYIVAAAVDVRGPASPRRAARGQAARCRPRCGSRSPSAVMGVAAYLASRAVGSPTGAGRRRPARGRRGRRAWSCTAPACSPCGSKRSTRSGTACGEADRSRQRVSSLRVHVQGRQALVEVHDREAVRLVQRARRSRRCSSSRRSWRRRSSTGGCASRRPTSSPTRSRPRCG